MIINCQYAIITVMKRERLSTLGSNLKAERVRKGYSQLELAELIDIHPNTLGKIESGKQSPSALIVYDIAKALDVSFEDLFKNID